MVIKEDNDRKRGVPRYMGRNPKPDPIEAKKALKDAVSHGKDAVRYVLEDMHENGELQAVLPELAKLKGLQQGGYHTEGDAWDHSLLAVEKLPENATKTTIMATLLHDIGKGGIHSDGTPVQQKKDPGHIDGEDFFGDAEYSFFGHPSVGAKMVDEIAKRINLSPEDHAIIRVAAEMHMNWDANPAKARKSIQNTLTECGVPETRREEVFDKAVDTLAMVMNADSAACLSNPQVRNDADKVLAGVKKYTRDELALKGQKLTQAAGVPVKMGGTLTGLVLDAINDKKIRNTQEEINAWVQTKEVKKEIAVKCKEQQDRLR